MGFGWRIDRARPSARIPYFEEAAENLALERRRTGARPSSGPRRLIRALTDQAVGHLTTGSNSVAGDILREARDLCAAEGGRTA